MNWRHSLIMCINGQKFLHVDSINTCRMNTVLFSAVGVLLLEMQGRTSRPSCPGTLVEVSLNKPSASLHRQVRPSLTVLSWTSVELLEPRPP